MEVLPPTLGLLTRWCGATAAKAAWVLASQGGGAANLWEGAKHFAARATAGLSFCRRIRRARTWDVLEEDGRIARIGLRLQPVGCVAACRDGETQRQSRQLSPAKAMRRRKREIPRRA